MSVRIWDRAGGHADQLLIELAPELDDDSLVIVANEAMMDYDRAVREGKPTEHLKATLLAYQAEMARRMLN